MKKIVIYPGRFQPMLAHHVQVFKKLEQTFPDAEIYIGTSNKVEGVKSPFDFREKQKIAQAHGLDPKKVLLANRPYHKDDYSKYFNEDNVAIIFAVGEKDLDRFPFNNVDEKTGLDMTVRGEARPKYYQKINTYKQDPQPMATRGYITIAPTIKVNDEDASASAFRSALQNAPSEEIAKEFFTKQFGEFNQQVFDLVYNKIKGSKMSEDINILRQLAGLPISEAPVEFDTAADPKAVTFLEPSANSAKMSIANRFPADVDPNDPEVKKEQFIQALIKSPANLLSEINERLDPKDPNNEAVGTKLNKIISELGSGAVAEKTIGDLAEEDKKFVINVVKVAITDMDLVAGDDSEPEYQPEPEEDDLDKLTNPMDKNESLDLSDIKSEYGIEESDMSLEDKLKDAIADHKERIEWYNSRMAELEKNPEFQNADDDEKDGWMWDYTDGINVQDEEHKLEHFRYALADHQENGTTHWWQGQFVYPDTAVRDEIAQELRDMGAWAGDIEESLEEGGECYHCDGSDPDCEHCNGTGYVQFPEDPQEREPEEESFDPSMEPRADDVMFDELMDVYAKHGEDALAKELGMSPMELDNEINEFGHDNNLHADDDRDEIIQGVLQDLIANRDVKDYGESIEEEVDSTVDKAFDAAIQELRTLSGLNS